jgi:mRNA-degrading endonuclease toxin of MazEF toxin-antitoxin module
MDAIICRVTSILRTGPLDVHLLDWSQAGLLNPSAARLDRVVTVEKSLLIKKLGYLTPSDLEGVRSTWNLMMKL